MNRLLLPLAALGVLTALALTGCSSAPSVPSPGSSSAQPATSPALTLEEPKADAKVPAGELKVKVTATGLTFVMPSNTNKPGEGHVHFTLDDQPFKMSTTPDYTFKDVQPGPHKLVAELVQNDTKPFEPPVKQEVSFTVE